MLTLQYIKEFATYKGFNETTRQWIYEHNQRKYAIDKEGIHVIN